MKASELSGALGRVQQVAGDVDVLLRDLDTGAVTALRSLGVHIDPSADGTGGTVYLEHNAEPAPDPAPAAAVTPPATTDLAG